jgi:hypothetical protein
MGEAEREENPAATGAANGLAVSTTRLPARTIRHVAQEPTAESRAMPIMSIGTIPCSPPRAAKANCLIISGRRRSDTIHRSNVHGSDRRDS